MKVIMMCVNIKKLGYTELFSLHIECPSYSSFSDFQNNDKRKFWKEIRHFVKNSNSSSSTPPLCSTLPNGENQCHLNDQDKANCLIILFLLLFQL